MLWLGRVIFSAVPPYIVEFAPTKRNKLAFPGEPGVPQIQLADNTSEDEHPTNGFITFWAFPAGADYPRLDLAPPPLNPIAPIHTELICAS